VPQASDKTLQTVVQSFRFPLQESVSSDRAV